jgi:putative ABC transport system permease protein
VRPALGRGFLVDEEMLGRDRRVVLSDGLWQRRFGADPSIVGTSVLVDGAQSEVVGVMPPGFDFPMGAEIWRPLAVDPKTPPSRTSGYLTVLGRLAPGKTVADAQAEMAVIAARLQRDFPRENRERSVKVYTLPWPATRTTDGGSRLPGSRFRKERRRRLSTIGPSTRPTST